jgi:enolase
MSSILSLRGREILDSRGIPTIEAEIRTPDGIFHAAVPSGTSSGSHEALELRDEDKSRHNGKGVLKAVSNLNKLIAPALIKKDPARQKELDELMKKLDGTQNKSKLGANAILAASIAICKAGAAAKKLPLYRHIAQLAGNSKLSMPIPMVLVIEGGKHAANSTDMQEFMVVPHKAGSFREAIKQGSEIYNAVREILKKEKYSIKTGLEGAFGPALGSNEKALQIILQGIKNAGYRPHKQIKIAIDAAASEFHKNGDYALSIEDETLTAKQLVLMYASLAKTYPIGSIEDGLSEDDWGGWKTLTRKLKNKMQLVGDDLTVTNVKRIEKAIKEKIISAVLIKPNQIGTVSETIDAIILCKKNGLKTIISHRSGETEDAFIADLAVGTSAGQCKFGAPYQAERKAKYDRLLKIEQELGTIK